MRVSNHKLSRAITLYALPYQDYCQNLQTKILNHLNPDNKICKQEIITGLDELCETIHQIDKLSRKIFWGPVPEIDELTPADGNYFITLAESNHLFIQVYEEKIDRIYKDIHQNKILDDQNQTFLDDKIKGIQTIVFFVSNLIVQSIKQSDINFKNNLNI